MVSSPPHVVIIGSVWPESNSTAAGQNMMGLISMFHRHEWQISFLSAATEGDHGDNLDEMKINTAGIALNCDSFDTQIAALAPDVVIFDRFMTEEQFSWRVRKACPQALRVLNSEDLHSLRHARHSAVKTGIPVEQAELNTELAQREVAAILRSDLTFIISPVEYALLKDYYRVPESQIHHLPLLTTAVPDDIPGFSERKDFITIGNFRHAPNWDSILMLKQHLWPRIRKQLPHAQLRIYGAYPPKKAMQLHQEKDGFRLEGWAKSASQVLSQARVLLAPLRFGAGVKGKIVNALQSGTPVITTPIGAEGIALPEAFPGKVCRSWDEMADEAVALYTRESCFEDMQRKMPAVLTSFDNLANTESALHIIEYRLSQLESWRQKQFMQSLVWHHSLKSSQYMSQWITEKNRLK